MRDAVAVEASGTPTTLFCTGAVAATVASAAATYRLPELPVASVEFSLFGLAPGEIAERASVAAQTIPEMILREHPGSFDSLPT